MSYHVWTVIVRSHLLKGNVPQKYLPNKKLGVWVNKQRMELKARSDGTEHNMKEWKIDMLRTANFVW
jgi:hypothetical protein